MTAQIKSGPAGLWLALVLVAGLAARLGVSAWGHNFDFDSYRLVADLMAQGKNVYAGTARYNYGPVWFNMIHWLDVAARHDAEIFRWLLVSLLSAADVGIFWLLWRQCGRLAATLFFLNPVSILITGYHNQFDNVAILIGLCAVQKFGDDFEKPLGRRKMLALGLLGLSLMTKHVFFAFPFWLAVKQRGLLQKFLIIVIPSAIFLAGFAPYWPSGSAGILENVFHYRSEPNAYAYNFLLPAGTRYFFDPQSAWFLTLTLFAFICKARGGLESALLYTGVLVAASPSAANQYLAIPIAMASVFFSPLFLAYTAISTLHLFASGHGPHVFSRLQKWGGFDDLAVLTLCAAIGWLLWRNQLLQGLHALWREIRSQFGIKK
jgi:hypothetical protein